MFDLFKWSFPFPPGTTFSDGFGLRIHPISGEQQFHNGLDVDAQMNTALRSPRRGVVLFSGYNDLNGYYVVILHPDGFRTGYAHLSKSLVKTGDQVRRGQVFAYSGATGYATGPHVHFTLTDAHGHKVDPAPVFFERRKKMFYLVLISLIVITIISMLYVHRKKLLLA